MERAGNVEYAYQTGVFRLCQHGAHPYPRRQSYLTIKGPSLDGGLSRYEFEKEITTDEAEHLLQLCEPGIIDKRRYLIPYEGHTYEVDEFYGDNEGLVMAEVELKHSDETFARPPFLGPEVTGDHRFYNKQMRANPFKNWRAPCPKHSNNRGQDRPDHVGKKGRATRHCERPPVQ